MATKKDSEKTNVTRIKASSSSSAKKETKTVKTVKSVKTKVVKAEKVKAPRANKPRFFLFRPFFAMGGYFKGSWVELRQVHWPNRRATWSLTGAVLVFTAFFVIFILLLDALFKYIFELILR